MATTGDCETLRELLPAFAFGLLDEVEKAQVEALLPLCPEAVGELRDYEGLAVRMLHSSTPVDPPPDLLAKLLTAAADVEPVEKSARKPDVPVSVVKKTPVVPSRVQRIPKPCVWLLTGAAAVILVLFLTGLVLMQTAQLSQTVQAQNSLLNLFASDQVVRFDLTDPSDTPTNAHAVLLCNAGERAAVIRAENFPVVDQNTRYQVWLWRDRDTKIDGGELIVNDNGWGTLVFEAPDVMGAFQYVSITPVVPVAGQNSPVVRGNLYPLTTPQIPG